MRPHDGGSAGNADFGGEWDARYGHLRRQSHLKGSLKLIVGRN